MAATAGKWLKTKADLGRTGVKHQCKMEYSNASTDTTTEPFYWAVQGDFTVILENRLTSTGALNNADVNVDVKFEASVDGDSWFEIYEEGNVLASGSQTGVHVYDYDTKGIFPHMRITLDPDGNLGASAQEDVYLTVVPHHMV